MTVFVLMSSREHTSKSCGSPSVQKLHYSLFFGRDTSLFFVMHTCVQVAIFGQLHHARRMPCYLDIVLLVDNGHVSFEMDNIQSVQINHLIS